MATGIQSFFSMCEQRLSMPLGLPLDIAQNAWKLFWVLYERLRQVFLSKLRRKDGMIMVARVSVETTGYESCQIIFRAEFFGKIRATFCADEDLVRKGSRAIEHKGKMPSNVAPVHGTQLMIPMQKSFIPYKTNTSQRSPFVEKAKSCPKGHVARRPCNAIDQVSHADMGSPNVIHWLASLQGLQQLMAQNLVQIPFQEDVVLVVAPERIHLCSQSLPSWGSGISKTGPHRRKTKACPQSFAKLLDLGDQEKI